MAEKKIEFISEKHQEFYMEKMQNSKSGYGQDALQATNILLKMSGQKVEKEFEVKDTKKTENKSNGEK